MSNSNSSRKVDEFGHRWISSPPLSDGMVLRFGEGLCCHQCAHIIRSCEVEPLGTGFRVVCAACHREILSFELRP
jgi:hypothetical protein